MEEGTQSAWLYETLERHVEEIVVASVPDSRGPKNDARNAYGLAEKLRIGAIQKSVFKAPAQFRRLREIARVLEMLVRDVVRVQARLKSIYRSRGVTTPGATVYSVKNRQEWLSELPPASAYAATKLYEHYDALTGIKDQTTADLITEAKLCPIARILQTAPGLGPIRVARMMPIVVTPHRFRTRVPELVRVRAQRSLDRCDRARTGCELPTVVGRGHRCNEHGGCRAITTTRSRPFSRARPRR